MVENTTNLLETWNKWGKLGAYALVGVGLLVILYHLVKLVTIRDYKSKYDYINKHEIDLLWYACIFMLLGAGFYANTLYDETGALWFFVRVFVTGMLALIIGVIIQNILKFYYPFFVEKRLKKLRYSPRISPKSGKAMKLLSEEEEDVYLDEGMQAEENIFSIDYDVWIDEETGYTQIEKYSGHLHALQCPECNYQTLKVVKEEIIESPTVMDEGELMKFYKCTYCNHKTKKTFKIAKLKETVSAESEGKPLATS
jgi:hypothetical protein